MEVSYEILLTGFPGTSDRISLGISTVVLIECGGIRVLVDTAGFGARGLLLSALSRKGIRPEQIDFVLFTHLHFDHCANFDLFPQAAYVCSRTEWEYAWEQEDIYVQKPVIRALGECRVRLIEEDGAEPVPGIRAVLSPGHTPGGLTYCFGSGQSRVAVTGDAIKNREELRSGEVVMTYDPAVSKDTIFKIRSQSDLVIPGHDCPLQIKENDVIPSEANQWRISFQKGLSVNGGRGNIGITLDV